MDIPISKKIRNSHFGKPNFWKPHFWKPILKNTFQETHFGKPKAEFSCVFIIRLLSVVEEGGSATKGEDGGVSQKYNDHH